MGGYRTYIVTGGGQDFVRVYSEKTYGVPPEQVVRTAGETSFGYDKDGRPFLTNEPKLLLNDAQREYAYGPANGLPPSNVGAFPQALYDQAAQQGWVVISMKNDWKRIFAFER